MPLNFRPVCQVGEGVGGAHAVVGAPRGHSDHGARSRKEAAEESDGGARAEGGVDLVAEVLLALQPHLLDALDYAAQGPRHRVHELDKVVGRVHRVLEETPGSEAQVVLVDEERRDADDEADEGGDAAGRVQEAHAPGYQTESFTAGRTATISSNTITIVTLSPHHLIYK